MISDAKEIVIRCRKCGEKIRPGVIRCPQCEVSLRPISLDGIALLILLLASIPSVFNFACFVAIKSYWLAPLFLLLIPAAVLYVLELRKGKEWTWNFCCITIPIGLLLLIPTGLFALPKYLSLISETFGSFGYLFFVVYLVFGIHILILIFFYLQVEKIRVFYGISNVFLNLNFRTTMISVSALFLLETMFGAISVCQSYGLAWRRDVTADKRNTLSKGTRNILDRIDQPITLKLYYSRKAAMKGPDWIQALDYHFLYVRSLLEEFEAYADDMINLETIDPRQFSQEEADAEQRYKLYKIPLPGPEKDEIINFFFGLVVETQFDEVETVSFFDPGRESLVEYEISRAIETATTIERKKIGILSSLPVMGTDPYMAYMMRQQGRQPQQKWPLVHFLEQQYEVEEIKLATTEEIKEDIDILLVIHPKDLEEKILFAIDQFVLSGKKAIVFIDPYCELDQPEQPPQRGMPPPPHPRNSNLDPLLSAWGLEMPADTYAADPILSGLPVWWQQQGPFGMNPQEIQPPITYLMLEEECFGDGCVVSSYLENFRMYFPGILQERKDRNPEIELIPLLQTTWEGNKITAQSSEIQYSFQWNQLEDKYQEGTNPVRMAYLARGKLKSAFPDKVKEGNKPEKEVTEDKNEQTEEDKDDSGNQKESENNQKKKLLAEGENCAVIVVSDVDCISIIGLAELRGMGGLSLTENIKFMQNALEFMSGSDDLIQLRSRDKPRRFTVVDEIARKAKKETKKKVADIKEKMKEIDKKRSESVQVKRDQAGGFSLEFDTEKLQQAELEEDQTYQNLEQQLRETLGSRSEKIETLGKQVELVNLLSAPGIILLIAVVLGIYRNAKRRRYISHVSDA